MRKNQRGNGESSSKKMKKKKKHKKASVVPRRSRFCQIPRGRMNCLLKKVLTDCDLSLVWRESGGSSTSD